MTDIKIDPIKTNKTGRKYLYILNLELINIKNNGTDINVDNGPPLNPIKFINNDNITTLNIDSTTKEIEVFLI